MTSAAIFLISLPSDGLVNGFHEPAQVLQTFTVLVDDMALSSLCVSSNVAIDCILYKDNFATEKDIQDIILELYLLPVASVSQAEASFDERSWQLFCMDRE